MPDFLEILRGRLALAPMAGVTDRVFRTLCREYRCPYAVSEMVSAKGFLLSSSMQYGRGLLDAAPGELLAVQLFGHEPDVVAEAACRLQEGPFCAIDINMGCPARKITGGGEGSALLRTPHLAQAIAGETVRRAVKPVTVKMRLGWDEQSRCHVDFAKRMEDAGVSAITVHGRTRDMMYSGQADWDAIAQVVSAVSIPVIANGDIRDVDSFMGIMGHTGCFAAMVGRGALGNPFIFEATERFLAGEPPRHVSVGERLNAAKRHGAMLCAYKGEGLAIAEMRKHAAWYTSGIRSGAALRKRIHTAATLADLQAILEDDRLFVSPHNR